MPPRVESFPEFAILTLDDKGLIGTWNSAARHLFGYAEAEAIGQHVGLIFTPEDRAAGVPQEEMRLARETGCAPGERWHVRKDGTRFYASGIIAPLKQGGRLLGYTKVARDLTGRQRDEEALELAHAQLESRVAERTRELAAANEALRRELGERRESDGARVRLLRLVVSAQEDERRRIARELHDQLGQEVTALGLKLAALKLAPELRPSTREQIAHLQEIVRQLDSDVDFLVWDLRPTGLDDLGLAEALADYVASWSKYFGIPAQLRSRLAERLQPEVETVLYRIAQESLTNVAKHARAGRVDLALERDCEHVSLSVTDDGMGFDPQSIPGAKALGLVGMRERAGLVGGSATIVSCRGAGTSVRVTVPLREALVPRLPAGSAREGA